MLLPDFGSCPILVEVQKDWKSGLLVFEACTHDMFSHYQSKHIVLAYNTNNVIEVVVFFKD